MDVSEKTQSTRDGCQRLDKRFESRGAQTTVPIPKTMALVQSGSPDSLCPLEPSNPAHDSGYPARISQAFSERKSEIYRKRERKERLVTRKTSIPCWILGAGRESVRWEWTGYGALNPCSPCGLRTMFRNFILTKNLKNLQTIFLKSLVKTLVIDLLILIETK